MSYKQLTFFRNAVQNISMILWFLSLTKFGKVYSDEALRLRGEKNHCYSFGSAQPRLHQAEAYFMRYTDQASESTFIHWLDHVTCIVPRDSMYHNSCLCSTAETRLQKPHRLPLLCVTSTTFVNAVSSFACCCPLPPVAPSSSAESVD